MKSIVALVVGTQANAEEVEEHPYDGHGRDGDEHAEDPSQATSGYHGQKDQNGMHMEGVALDLGCQQVTLQLLYAQVGGQPRYVRIRPLPVVAFALWQQTTNLGQVLCEASVVGALERSQQLVICGDHDRADILSEGQE